MKYAIITIGYLFAALVQANTLPDKHYEDFTLEGFGQLPRFWGQKAVFTPEARRWLARLQAEGYAFHTPSIGVWDTFPLGEEKEIIRNIPVARVSKLLKEKIKDFNTELKAEFQHWQEYSQIENYMADLEEHGNNVVSLMVGAAPWGISVLGELHFILNRIETFLANNFGHDMSHLFRGGRPDILNVSIDVTNRLPISHTALANHTLFIMSAGNTPLKQYNFFTLAGRLPILVGASNPRGEISSYSSSAGVNIYAPGEHLFLDGKVWRGTSYAAPLVTGALADLFGILPPNKIVSLKTEVSTKRDYYLIPDQSTLRQLVVHMLQQTSTSTAMANEFTGGGILNHYKLLRVAHRIAQQAKEGEQTVAQLIEDEHMYDFSGEAQQLYDEAMHLRDASKTNQQEVLFKLREAVALDADHHAARRALAEVYAQKGYVSLSEFYAPPAQLQRLRLHKTVDFNRSALLYFKVDLLTLYAGELHTPELVRQYLNKDLVLAMMWASSGYIDLNKNFIDLIRDENFIKEQVNKKLNLSADDPWSLLIDSKNPYSLIINYSKDVQQAKLLVEAVLGNFDLNGDKTTISLPSVKRGDEYEAEEVVARRRIEIDTAFLLEPNTAFYITDEARVARHLPTFAGQRLNLVEWSILHDSRKLFANHHKMLKNKIQDEIIHGYRNLAEMLAADSPDAETLETAHKVTAELEGHISFTIQHTNNSVALGKLLDLHQQISRETEHLALLQRQLGDKGLQPQLQRLLKRRLIRVR